MEVENTRSAGLREKREREAELERERELRLDRARHSHAAYVAGDTFAGDFPTTQYFNSTLKPKQAAYGGGQDAFVVNVDPWGFLNEGYST